MFNLLRLRFRNTIVDIEDTLYDISLDPRLMPNSLDVHQRQTRSNVSTPTLRPRDDTASSFVPKDPGANVRVVVRVRAFLPRELERNAKCIVEMDPATERTSLLVPQETDFANARGARTRRVLEEKSFTFDKSFWSHNTEDEHYATQEHVYDSLGEEFLDHNFEGYHTCIFTYGQTGSGKSYTMMGTPDQPGLIPRTCEDLFQRIASAQDETPNISYNVKVSYFEVYNEHVRDLLAPVVPNKPPYYLKVRESPTEGPYVKDLTEVPVRGLQEIIRWMRIGDRSRTVASTKMNDTSSRSHAVFTIMLKQIHHDLETDDTTERSSRIRLVDLAGSERAKSTEATGQRLREGSNINKSLTTLGRVIAALADPKSSASRPSSPVKSGRGRTPGAANSVVPYRDSILTWLLKDSLGGNSKTAMIACISPTDYDETLSTLRYADQAKRIRTRAVVNQVDGVSAAERDAQIAAMAAEIRQLQLVVSDSQTREKSALDAEQQLEEYQARVRGLQQLMEEKSLVAEGKIRSLQTENEALRLHLKLALESLRNPIKVSSFPTTSLAMSAGDATVPLMAMGEVSTAHGRKTENKLVDDPFVDSGRGVTSDDDQGLIYEHDDDYDTYEEEDDDDEDTIDLSEKAHDMNEYMSGLLKDLSMFRRKIGDDKTRFLDELGVRKPLGVRTNII
ncbi:hypothetical protein NEUTE1DRAFT_127890 [Neurospora tetrasperma FGSC 2508]|uniref:Kinesin-like protein n=1 Tax=Neurospora tetrasperma (strain FGSC 2508 / ATCC MYA-4615 / P0657) TaxID=510951 RepID=F8MC03_NEUT8|nr:uncharacterized protein NEUTE1DRAFT_127890 [Neurospora tetrasperma FGSC 2508]EGO61212.1 hypothetical protein NEUTE1DRAFT_127890 [Neurospora tetrasperma FGSC 2508]EGZ74785.1 kinesin-domain-containing protein [Neurospora tetrasperma FGSC 2509]